jgi:7-cyano-7-deazaguanine synthase in queuosine biosynthesis
MSEKVIIKKPYKLAISISSGIDSLTSYYWAIEELNYNPKDIICIMFDYGQEYFHKEYSCVKWLKCNLQVLQIDILEYTSWNQPYSPNRNAIFATIASKFADRVWICANKGDNNKYAYDKNDKFFELATMFNSASTGKHTIIESPFINKFKHEIIAWGLKNNVDYNNSISCYHPSLNRCGMCADCFSRFINMKYNGIDEVFTQLPYKSDIAINQLAEYKRNLENNDFTKNHKKIIDITFKVMKGVNL